MNYPFNRKTVTKPYDILTTDRRLWQIGSRRKLILHKFYCSPPKPRLRNTTAVQPDQNCGTTSRW
jgi:hypothetical protein